MTANAALERILDVSVIFRESMYVIFLMTFCHSNALFADEMIELAKKFNKSPAPILTDKYTVQGR
ncbi:hypothetical protein LMG27177_06754 [Paraburkholderia fynbosensis]|uniref:Uncharacterized protein n=1 Tax=Paraburkholderia fynbosensis TaxID=1200993 RepID=A0A6J5H1U7_9BURK|nr:hypothetical protein LMG27177_06754 [Paraburkholderia fynbosensis]